MPSLCPGCLKNAPLVTKEPGHNTSWNHVGIGGRNCSGSNYVKRRMNYGFKALQVEVMSSFENKYNIVGDRC